MQIFSNLPHPKVLFVFCPESHWERFGSEYYVAHRADRVRGGQQIDGGRLSLGCSSVCLHSSRCETIRES